MIYVRMHMLVAVKRIMQEAKELAVEGSFDYEAHPLEAILDNIFEWHFTVRGPSETEFENGSYTNKKILSCPYIISMIQPNGRFELNTKICLSITGFHPEYWQPAWGIRTVILAVMGFFPTEARGAIGGLDYTKEERIVLAKSSKAWKCPVCQISNEEVLKDIPSGLQRPQRPPEDMPNFSLTFKPEGQPPAEKSSQDSSKDHNLSIQPTEDSIKEKLVDRQPLSTVGHVNDNNDSLDNLDDLDLLVTTEPSQEAEQVNKKKTNMELQASSCATDRTPDINPETVSQIHQRTNTNTPNSMPVPVPVSVPAHHNPNNILLATENTPTNLGRSPIWLDVLIGILAVLLFGLIARRFV
ncbi:hypothetical protein PHYBLDRAFT_188942 [Phycomyces blakesleeanus NRRL 1555(-)]|uniref:UBC core domain-containing protein n=1 Tax=Phycomyces blakesleeanus (strain ATCC 8743b / DSM 1359 / FGSC 10004 / NBRC 33097 / NRRL 1555) TaxID=763407 RepID=A0A162TJP5_PHYB8|nr:hypothetical protein PHYBLDRAFT_188942 [Phycomyces blakesleeanus NRRL 1555(-)]OAD67673.1 hypothetical protein PHYBLDRAFT_188942 [Phycomyces blakesleeanus NRRL 1555(-)]|eukprot:XP_018285713.1 hypothetical protein PHYBLDRAFT_188942 [Phycomyces blakesleeanus NRRL 1555(-)]